MELHCCLCVFFVLAIAGLTVGLLFVQKGAVTPAHLFQQTREGVLESAWLVCSPQGISGYRLYNKAAAWGLPEERPHQ